MKLVNWGLSTFQAFLFWFLPPPLAFSFLFWPYSLSIWTWRWWLFEKKLYQQRFSVLGAPHISILVTDSVKLTLGGGWVMAVGTNFFHQNIVFHSPFPLIDRFLGPNGASKVRVEHLSSLFIFIPAPSPCLLVFILAPFPLHINLKVMVLRKKNPVSATIFCVRGASHVDFSQR